MNLIRDAISVVTERGMAKGTTLDDSGRMCVGGALSFALTGDHNEGWVHSLAHDTDNAWGQAMRTVGDVAKEQYPERINEPLFGSNCWHDAQSFNNHRDTTPLELVTVMEKAAVRLDELV